MRLYVSNISDFAVSLLLKKKEKTNKYEFTESKTDGSLEDMPDPMFRSEVL